MLRRVAELAQPCESRLDRKHFADPALPFRWAGDWASGEQCINRLIPHAERHALTPYRAIGFGFKGEMLLKRGEIEAGMDLLIELIVWLFRALAGEGSPISCAAPDPRIWVSDRVSSVPTQSREPAVASAIGTPATSRVRTTASRAGSISDTVESRRLATQTPSGSTVIR